MPQTLQTKAEGLCPSSAVTVTARISRKGDGPAEAACPTDAASWTDLGGGQCLRELSREEGKQGAGTVSRHQCSLRLGGRERVMGHKMCQQDLGSYKYQAGDPS